MKKISVALFAALVASACCTRLPEMPPKRVTTLPAIAGSHAVEESSAIWRDERRSRDVPVKIYAPADVSGPKPVVIFSHGIGEDRDSYAYIGRALAANGFLAVHVTHAGTDKAVLKTGYWNLYRATKKAGNWVNRPYDVSFVIDRLRTRTDADMSRIAVAGHSAGAFTAFALAGVTGLQGESFRDGRVKVIVPMSMPKIEGLSYTDVRVPALNITGTCDSSLIFRTRQRDRRVPFEQTTALHQYLATIGDVNHDTFSNKTDPHHDTIVALTILFLRAYLLDDATARAWFDEPGTTTIGRDRLTIETKSF
ncbi:MAG TPA: alpha/beta hydrolase [Thermoanaerobaculia bacterium]